MSPLRNKAQRKALLQTLLILGVLLLAMVGFVAWAAFSPDSELARSFRQAVGLPEPGRAVEPSSTLPADLRVAPPPASVVVEVAKPVPPPLPEINYAQIYRQRHLWPDTLELLDSQRVYIRYNGNVYGHVDFTSGMLLKVDALGARGEVFGWIDGNYVSLSLDETNFDVWFERAYGDRYRLAPMEEPARDAGVSARHQVGTPEGDTEFWTEMRIWCSHNYNAISLEIGEDTLIFRWLPREDVPVDYNLEARAIARNYLLLRSARGSNENYAACEIRHPVTDELLGTSAIFIPQL